MVDKSRMTLQKLARWHPTQSNPVHDRKGSAALWDGSLQPLDHENLKQGASYIIKIQKVSVGLFQGWNDDMCCFAVLRSENIPLRWSQARYLPGDFDAFDAFDEAGNPPVHLWTRYLHVDVPVNWFIIFEEARRKQREWNTLVFGQQNQQLQQQHQQHQHYHHDSSSAGLHTDHLPTMIIDGHPHHQPQQQLYDNYSDIDTFSASPSRSLQYEQTSSISSLQLPLDVRADEIIDMPPPPTSTTTSPPHPLNAVNSSPSSYDPQMNFNEMNQPHLPAACIQPLDKYNTASSVQPRAAKSNEMNHQISHLQRHNTCSSSLPNVTKETRIPPTNLTTQQITPSPSPKELEMALDELTFPHDDDQFSIHSDFQPNINAPDSSTIDDPYCTNNNNNTAHWKKRSIKKILSRSSNIAK